jgi:hypothetical protein
MVNPLPSGGRFSGVVKVEGRFLSEWQKKTDCLECLLEKKYLLKNYLDIYILVFFCLEIVLVYGVVFTIAE